MFDRYSKIGPYLHQYCITICLSSWVFIMFLHCFPIHSCCFIHFPSVCAHPLSAESVHTVDHPSAVACTCLVYCLTSVFLLFVVLIVFLPCVIFLLYSSLSLLFSLSLCMCRHHSYCSYCFLLPSYCRVDYYKYSCML